MKGGNFSSVLSHEKITHWSELLVNFFLEMRGKFHSCLDCSATPEMLVRCVYQTTFFVYQTNFLPTSIILHVLSFHRICSCAAAQSRQVALQRQPPQKRERRGRAHAAWP